MTEYIFALSVTPAKPGTRSEGLGSERSKESRGPEKMHFKINMMSILYEIVIKFLETFPLFTYFESPNGSPSLSKKA